MNTQDLQKLEESLKIMKDAAAELYDLNEDVPEEYREFKCTEALYEHSKIAVELLEQIKQG